MSSHSVKPLRDGRGNNAMCVLNLNIHNTLEKNDMMICRTFLIMEIYRSSNVRDNKQTVEYR